jgi:WD40 repeat protein
LAIAGNDSVLNIWNLASKKNVVYRGHTAEILSVAYSNNTGLLASASKDESIRIWNYSLDRKSKLIKGHHAPVRSVEFSLDG